MREAGFNVTHLYGLTEVYGPAVVNDWHAEWDVLPAPRAGGIKGAAGGSLSCSGRAGCAGPETMSRCPGMVKPLGEVMFRGNVVMKGYLKNKQATDEAFAGGWFHSGDLGVVYPDGYIQLKDRSKDIIISGGENISSIEIEEVLHKHPQVVAAAVVAMPHDKWGETPCAFIELVAGTEAIGRRLILSGVNSIWPALRCPANLCLRNIVKTSTGKVQKFILRQQAEKLAGEQNF